MEILENIKLWQENFNNGWLSHVRKTGEVDWQKYQHPRNRSSPHGKGIEISSSRLLLVTSSGAYLKNQQAAFDTNDLEGDYSLRTFSNQVSPDDIDYAHGHYDDTLIRQDMEVGIPLKHLHNFVREGKLGGLTNSVASFMGYQPDSAQVATNLAPELLAFARHQGATAALFAPL